MKAENGKTTSIWMEQAPAAAERLDRDIECDVCIVGAGIAGLSIAYHLAKAGKRVVVLDDGPVAHGETIRTTAHLSNAIDDRYNEIEKMHGKDGARIACESHTAAIARIEEIVRAENIDCDFRRLDGFLFPVAGHVGSFMQEEFGACQRAGVPGVEMVENVPGMAVSPGPGIRFPQQGQFHIGKYIKGLTKAIREAGGEIFSNTHANTMEGGDVAKVVTANEKTVTAKYLVVATNSPVNDRVAVHTKQMPYRSYVVGLRVAEAPADLALYWDTGDPYHYVRYQQDEEGYVLIVGGEDHKTGQADDGDKRFRNLEIWARDHFPQAGDAVYRWSGQVLETDDGLAFIGRNPLDKENVFIATGDSGMGMTHGTIAGMLISDLILGKQNPWAKVYDPGRITLSAAGEWARENVNTFAQYRDLITPGDIDNVEQVSLGEGAVMREGFGKVAVYRDESGKVHRCNAICPHLGAVVRWNSLEKTWDCPAHGSRFMPTGEVCNGPSNGNLEAYKGEDEKAA